MGVQVEGAAKNILATHVLIAALIVCASSRDSRYKIFTQATTREVFLINSCILSFSSYLASNLNQQTPTPGSLPTTAPWVFPMHFFLFWFNLCSDIYDVKWLFSEV